MPKYYVQSGNVRTVISADDGEKAALWVVHKAMQQVVPVYDDDETTAEQKSQAVTERGVMVLGEAIHVSEVGFDRSDRCSIETLELVIHWHQLMVALAKLDALIR